MRSAVATLCLCLLPTAATAQPAPSARPRLNELVVEGITVFAPTEIRWTLRLEDGAELPDTPGELADRLQRRYHREGYAKATVSATFDEAAGRLTLRADEGRIDAIAFEGVEQQFASELRDAFAVRPGDIYNTREISRAIGDVLRPTRGAVRLSRGRRAVPGTVFHDSAELRHKTAAPFDLIERNGRRTLVVNVRREHGDVDATFGTDSREDWYSPVDGLNLALGFGATLFDQRRFNHTYLQGYVGYKFARDAVGYDVGLERAMFGTPDSPRVFLNADLHDVTSSDDFWRLSVTEQSLVALTFKNSFRDYYVERGYQVGAVLQPNGVSEVTASWRADRHEPLANQTDYSFFRDDETFRPNRLAADGRLHALLVGYTLDTRGLDEESGRSALRRHVAPAFFGSSGGVEPGARFDWTTEVARSAFGGDFEFTRHIGNARAYLALSPAQRLNGRLIVGTSTGTLPPQRLFALGGIGTVHGYTFKDAAGERMLLANAEYVVGAARRVRGLAFLDVGRVYRPIQGSRDDWLTGVGVGVAFGDVRIDFGWRANDVPDSLQVLVRFGPTF